mmetsp:Transcript_55803/g.128144  ORF Transcript_55803/g.128144 Transcript_55803/m.128144 type:complete len:299 (-) Transcript_55803:314-1210(-)
MTTPASVPPTTYRYQEPPSGKAGSVRKKVMGSAPAGKGAAASTHLDARTTALNACGTSFSNATTQVPLGSGTSPGTTPTRCAVDNASLFGAAVGAQVAGSPRWAAATAQNPWGEVSTKVPEQRRSSRISAAWATVALGWESTAQPGSSPAPNTPRTASSRNSCLGITSSTIGGSTLPNSLMSRSAPAWWVKVRSCWRLAPSVASSHLPTASLRRAGVGAGVGDPQGNLPKAVTYIKTDTSSNLVVAALKVPIILRFTEHGSKRSTVAIAVPGGRVSTRCLSSSISVEPRASTTLSSTA